MPSEVRPIDLFSVILRVMASASTGILRSWTAEVLHPGQFPSKGGVVVACARIAWTTELSLIGVASFGESRWILPRCLTCLVRQ